MHITTRVFIWSMLVVSGVHSACLNDSTLRFLGIPPTEPHESQMKSICSSTYAQFRSCVDEKNFDEAIKARLDVSVRSESAKFSYLHEELENVIAKFKKLTLQLEKSGSPSIDMAIQLASVKKLIPDNVGRLRKQILRSAHHCFAVQSHIAIGSLCLLSSEAATDYMSSSSEDSESKTINVNSWNEADEAFVIKVTPQAAGEIFAACVPLVQGSCIYHKIKNILALSEGKASGDSDDPCPADFIDCLSDQSNCKAEVKNAVLEVFFKPFSSHLVGSEEIAHIYGVLRNKVSGYWEQGLKQLMGTYSRLIDLTAAPLEKLTSLTHKSYQYVFNLLGRSHFPSKETSSLDFSKTTQLVLPPDRRIKFVVATDGRDVVADGAASGVYIQNSPLIPALFGLVFVLIQMFV